MARARTGRCRCVATPQWLQRTISINSLLLWPEVVVVCFYIFVLVLIVVVVVAVLLSLVVRALER